MGERGPKPVILQTMEPARRAELDEAIVEGRLTKAELFERYGEQLGIGYRAFCNYAAQLEARAKHRYVGELLTGVFGNLPDADIDVRAKGLMVAMMDKLAGDVLQDGDLKPRDLRDLVQSYDLIRRGAIADAQEERVKAEWEVMRMAGVAEAAVRIKGALELELKSDLELQHRLFRVIEQTCASDTRPAQNGITSELYSRMSKKHRWKDEVRRAFKQIWGVDVPDEREGTPRPSPQQAEKLMRQEARELWGLGPETAPDAQTSEPSRGAVCNEVDRLMRGEPEANDGGQ